MASILLSRIVPYGNLYGLAHAHRLAFIETLNHRSSFIEGRREIHASPTLCIGQRKGKKVRSLTKRVQERLTKTDTSPYWRQPDVVPTSPLTRTEHPKSRFAEDELKLKEAISKVAEEHQPAAIFSGTFSQLGDKSGMLSSDPYEKEPIRCILCPKRYAVDYIKPDYKNPKLLAQFVSPHTGLVYKKHITGLCEQMQEEVEREVKKSQHAGFMST